MAVLAARIGDWRGRRLHVAPASKFGWSGHLVVRGARADMLVYDDSATGLYGRHGFLHELGHLVLDHDGVTFDPATTAAADVARRLADRIGYANQEERDAELWATLVGLDTIGPSPGD
ncbi:hypothetical protein ALI22I_20100 [Saccharothrix sp. ALI-22-I]|uniref:hypothetical protein n=1 Tax=Saccharothrix sp. ALI-22-I TaxID=1933778 RepID=UPI00097BCA84|nr:hypothetical protein [Saccharothrix sp. ALI-22-I]ONI88047.1 hypothetical protein ALI22I_20100 [Saccharothrix sp. ALI-22-I]